MDIGTALDAFVGGGGALSSDFEGQAALVSTSELHERGVRASGGEGRHQHRWKQDECICVCENKKKKHNVKNQHTQALTHLYFLCYTVALFPEQVLTNGGKKGKVTKAAAAKMAMAGLKLAPKLVCLHLPPPPPLSLSLSRTRTHCVIVIYSGQGGGN